MSLSEVPASEFAPDLPAPRAPRVLFFGAGTASCSPSRPLLALFYGAAEPSTSFSACISTVTSFINKQSLFGIALYAFFFFLGSLAFEVLTALFQQLKKELFEF